MLQAAEAAIADAKSKLEDATSALQKGITVQQECGIVVTMDSDGMPCTGDDAEPCEPLVPLWNAEQSAKSALAATEQDLVKCKEQVQEASDGQNKKWCRTQLYWTKGLAGTAEELRALVQAGVPVVAALHLHSAGQSSEETGTGELQDPLIFDAVAAEHMTAPWDDSILDVSTIDVTSGRGGGQFVSIQIYEIADQGSESDAVEGAHEMGAALQRLSECLPTYRSWKAEHSLLRLPEVPIELSHYHNLLDTVPQEQQSIAVMLHCLVEQAACSICEAADESSESLEVRTALNLMDAVLSTVHGPVICPASVPTSSQHVSSVMEGDIPQMASHGLLTGLVAVPKAPDALITPPTTEFLRADGTVNVRAVEEHMAHIVWCQWQQFVKPVNEDTDALVKESMLQALAAQVR